MLILTTLAFIALIPSIVSGAPLAAASPSQMSVSHDLSDQKVSVEAVNDHPSSTTGINKFPFDNKGRPHNGDIRAAVDNLAQQTLRTSLEESSETRNTTYTIIIQTGDKVGAGTDANVFVQFGEAQGNYLEWSLPHVHYSRDSIDTFWEDSTVFMDEICFLVLGLEKSHFHASWYAPCLRCDTHTHSNAT